MDEDEFERMFNGRFRAGDAQADAETIERNGILRSLVEEVRKGDKAYIDHFVIDYWPKVQERPDDVELIHAFAKASLFADHGDLCYSSLELLAEPSPAENEAMGITAYCGGNIGCALRHFKKNPQLKPLSRAAYALGLFQTGERHLVLYTDILEPIKHTSDLAATILGCIATEHEFTQHAERYFATAASLKPHSERIRLDHLRSMVLNGKMQEAYAQANEFYVDTKSELSADAFSKELESRELRIPPVSLSKGLYAIVSALLD